MTTEENELNKKLKAYNINNINNNKNNNNNNKNNYDHELKFLQDTSSKESILENKFSKVLSENYDTFMEEGF